MLHKDMLSRPCVKAMNKNYRELCKPLSQSGMRMKDVLS